jgi:hypothetical protein
MMHRINRDLGFFYLQKEERVVMINAVCEEEFVKKIHFVFSLAMIASFKKHKWSRSTTRCIEDQGLLVIGTRGTRVEAMGNFFYIHKRDIATNSL